MGGPFHPRIRAGRSGSGSGLLIEPANCFQAKPAIRRKAQRFLADLPSRQTPATAADVKHWLKSKLTE
jgi:hypothetical protein